jgi:hypothetical protein
VLLFSDPEAFMRNPAKTGMVFYCLAALAILFSFLNSSRASAWLTNNSMLTARVDHTATLLQNGTILIAGGRSGASATNAAELYDPATGLWTPTGSMQTARYLHTATLLQNGEVLVAGGVNSNAVTSAELYDPASGTWKLTGPLNVARSLAKATLLQDGQVLITGGNSTTPTFTNTATTELYDPAIGSWTLTGDLNEGRSSHTATLLPDGRVVVAGGTGNLSGDPTNSDPDLSSIEMYDPSLGTWTLVGSLMQKRSWHTATLLPNGLLLFAGGVDENGGNPSSSTYYSSAELFDPVTKNTSSAASMTTARASHSATLLPHGSVLVAGGQTDSTGDSTNSVEVYNPSANTWSTTNSLQTARSLHTTTLLPGGKVLVAGGETTNNSAISATEIYDSTIAPSTGSWNFTGSMQNPRANFTATLLPNGKVLVTGGLNAPDSRACELYDPLTQTWASTGSMNYGRFNHNATLLANGKVLVTGSLSFAPTPSETYDAATGIWTTNGPMIGFTYKNSATLLRNEKVLVAGDTGMTGVSAQLFDPHSNAWTATGPMITPRTWHQAVALPNGKVFVVGGLQSSTYLSSAEIYDPIIGQWNAAGHTRASSYTFTAAALLPCGKVLVAGADTNIVSVADLFDPSTGIWSATGAPQTNHFQPMLIVLPSGKALMTGEAGPPEIYDPASGRWTTTPPMNLARQQDRAVLLADGRFMDIGGDVDTNNSIVATSTAEIYDPGLYPTNTPRPQITSSTPTLNLGDSLAITGTAFRGASEGSSGSWQGSATDYPLVQLRSIESGQTTFLLATNWSKKSFTSLPVWNFPPGETLATVFVNGIQSTSSVVNIAVPIPIATTLANPRLSPDGALQFTFTNTPGAMLGVLASTNLALPSTNWTPLSGVTEISPGEFEFTDLQATNHAQRFYRVFAP